MSFCNAKIYFDGSHYIAIPQSNKAKLKKSKARKSPKEIELKRKFEESYNKNKNLKNKEKTERIITELNVNFDEENTTKNFVTENIQRKQRNAIVRRTRLARKIYIGEWNWFCTFTYDDKKHDENSFKTKLSNCFKHMASRKKWKYIGVWERSPKNNRLHFHGIFFIPEKSMVGELIEKEDYSLVTKTRQRTNQNTYFLNRFGRNDFSPIPHKSLLGNAMAYLMKYIEKSGEKIVYSRNTPTYFISDIMDDDIVCTIGQEDRKLLLFDNFGCWDEGVYIGRVNQQVIDKMRKTN